MSTTTVSTRLQRLTTRRASWIPVLAALGILIALMVGAESEVC